MDCAGMKSRFNIIDLTYSKGVQKSSPFPISFFCLSGFIFSILAFFPGWMSPDSFNQYVDAKSAVYVDWHPVLMAWWWSKLDSVYAGPALMLLQNLLLYWAAWGLLAHGMKYLIGRIAYVIPLLGFWPGVLFPLGQIWKDVFFACSMFFTWALMVNICAQQRRPFWIERAAIFMLAAFSFGVKTNGLTAIPFLLYFWVHIEGWKQNRLFIKLLLTMGLTVFAIVAAVALVPPSRIVNSAPFQYTQSYDLLAISVKTGEVVLPKYITDRVGSDINELKKLYWVGGNDILFYRTHGSLRTADHEHLRDLRTKWRHAIAQYPFEYISHRWDNFFDLTRIGAKETRYVAEPSIVQNPWGFSFSMNRFAEWLSSQRTSHPTMFFPWVYMLATALAMVVLLVVKFQRVMVVSIGGSAICFILPHLLITPAADYRYLYYSYFCAMMLVVIACAIIVKMAVSPSIYLLSKLPIVSLSSLREDKKST